MDEKNEDSSTKQLHQSLPFLEVLCKNSGKIRRFSVGTEAEMVLTVENVLMASHIEAVKEGELGEEPVSFGHSSLLVTEGPVHKGTRRERKAFARATDDHHSEARKESSISILYIGKILFAFLLIFVFCAIFTVALENLPRLILFINSLYKLESKVRGYPFHVCSMVSLSVARLMTDF
ncbi:small nuclear ribonucleoprotein family protein [Striga asiatica]|uniref:Small nuclear ribonucleoprotein family protein n=1 Tax=Striga asiatica TaxID=4170 RepID=A0A5A7R2V0_STRAF|nr:small nuclear ribonucleoprotein family protein [Striga asiatica]